MAGRAANIELSRKLRERELARKRFFDALYIPLLAEEGWLRHQ